MESGVRPKRARFDFDEFNALAAEGAREWAELKPECDKAIEAVDAYFKEVAEHYNPGTIGGVAILGYEAQNGN